MKRGPGHNLFDDALVFGIVLGLVVTVVIFMLAVVGIIAGGNGS